MGFRKLPECHLPVLVRFMGRPTEGDQDPELNAIALDAYGRVGTGRLAVWCLPGAGLSAPWSSSQLAPARAPAVAGGLLAVAKSDQGI